MKKNDVVKESENAVKESENAVKESENAVKATPLYKGYLSAYASEEKAASKTAEKIKAIKETGLTITEFFSLLWSENYKVPENWPLNNQGSPLSPLSSKTRAALPEVNRLVSALAMRAKRENDKTDKTAKTAKTAKTEKADSDNDNDGTGAQIASFDKALCVKQLQALLVRSFEVEEDQVIYDLAKKLVQLLLDKK